jgi:hypothetical protein
MEYFMPWTPRQTSLVMWHSSSTQVWQNRWDGGEGFKDMFLRRDYPVYLWDGPRVGRANWACDNMTYTPSYKDQANFVNWNFGPSFMQWWPGVQFPTTNQAAWLAATSARYDEMDTIENVQLQTDASTVAADSGKVGNSIVYLTNSAGGLRAMFTQVKAQKSNIKAIVAYECVGFIYPDNIGVQPATTGGFGPFVVPLADFKKLTQIKIQFLWGAHRDTYQFYNESVAIAKLINSYGGDAKVIRLADVGIPGSTHLAFADMDNDKVANFLDAFLAKYGLDDYA